MNDATPRYAWNESAPTTPPGALLDARWQTFYRAYPWMQARLKALEAALPHGTKAKPVESVTLTGDTLREARALLADLRAHLARCYDAEVHQAFRQGKHHAKKEKAHDL